MTLAATLRRELAPRPGRLRATARLTVALLFGSLVVLGFHLPHGHWMAITVLVVSQANAGASLDKCLQRIAGTLGGGATAIVALAAFADQPWFLVPLVGFLCGMGLFLSRTTTAPYAGLLFCITAAILIPMPGRPEMTIDDSLWRIAMVIAGVVIAGAAQLWLWPDDPEELLADGVAAELERVARWLLGTGGPTHTWLEESRLGEQLDLLANAEARHPGLRPRHDDATALVIELDRLLVGVLWLERVTAGAGRPVALGARLARAAADCERIAGVLRGSPSDTAPTESIDETRAPAAIAPALAEIERALAAIGARASAAFGPAATRVTSPRARRPFFTPAFSASNRAALRFALPGALGASICLVLIHALAWPGLATSIATCVIVSQTSFGASVRKGALRVTGAVAGGLLGAAMIIVAMPNVGNLGIFLAVLAVGFAAAAWVTVGSPRIAYAGVQLGFAFSMYAVDAWAPNPDLVVGRDRVLGVLLGIAVMAVLEAALGPARAASAMRESLASALRHLASLARVATGPRPRDAPASPLRHALYRDLADAARLEDEARAEPGAADPAAAAERQALLRVASSAQEVSIALMAIARWRDATGVDAATADAGIEVAEMLEHAAECVLRESRPPVVPTLGHADTEEANALLHTLAARTADLIRDVVAVPPDASGGSGAAASAADPRGAPRA